METVFVELLLLKGGTQDTGKQVKGKISYPPAVSTNMLLESFE